MSPANVLELPTVDFVEMRDFVFNKGNPPGDPITHRLLAHLLCKFDALLAHFNRDQKGKLLPFKPKKPSDYAPASFPVDDPIKRKERNRNKMRKLTLGIRGNRDG